MSGPYFRRVSLRSKRFRGVGEQRKTKDGILPARNWGESQNKKEGVGGGTETLATQATPECEIFFCVTHDGLSQIGTTAHSLKFNFAFKFERIRLCNKSFFIIKLSLLFLSLLLYLPLYSPFVVPLPGSC